MIAEGKYKGRGVLGENGKPLAQLSKSKDKGTPGVQVIVEITEGEHAGLRLRWDGWLTDGGPTGGAAQRTLESLRHLGWQGELLTDLTGIDQNLVEIVVEHETRDVDDNGEIKSKKFARAVWINRIGGGAKINDEARMGDTDAKALAQRFRSLARGVPASGGPKAPPSTSKQTKPAGNGSAPQHAPDAPDPTDDDGIPF